MNQKLLFVSIIAIVAAFGMSAIAVGLGSNMAFAKTNCQNKGLVAANVCDTDVCVNAQVLSGRDIAGCKQ
jgi:hypothetical protein